MTSTFAVLPIGDIYPDPNQPRTTGMDDADLVDLTASMKVRGVIQILRVTADDKGRYKIIVGERRYRAALKAGLIEIPAMIDEEMTEAERLEIQLTENILRRNLSIQERADAIARFTALHPEHKEAARRLGISNGHLSSLLELQNLTPEVASLSDANVTKDATTLVLANQLMKKAPEIGKAVFAKAVEDGKLPRKVVADALAPYRRPKKKNASPAEATSSEAMLTPAVAVAVAAAPVVAPPASVPRSGSDGATPDADDRPLVRAPSREKLHKVCAALRIQPGADPAAIFEQLVDHLLAATPNQDRLAA